MFKVSILAPTGNRGELWAAGGVAFFRRESDARRYGETQIAKGRGRAYVIDSAVRKENGLIEYGPEEYEKWYAAMTAAEDSTEKKSQEVRR